MKKVLIWYDKDTERSEEVIAHALLEQLKITNCHLIVYNNTFLLNEVDKISIDTERKLLLQDVTCECVNMREITCHNNTTFKQGNIWLLLSAEEMWGKGSYGNSIAGDPWIETDFTPNTILELRSGFTEVMLDAFLEGKHTHHTKSPLLGACVDILLVYGKKPITKLKNHLFKNNFLTKEQKEDNNDKFICLKIKHSKSELEIETDAINKKSNYFWINELKPSAKITS